MEKEMITISRKNYEELLENKKIDQEFISDIARGIKDILQGKVKEI